MTTKALIGLGLFAVLVTLPPLVRPRRGVSPRVAAGAYLVGMVGWALLPALWLACLGGALGSWLGAARAPGGGCLLGLDHLEWQLLGYVPSTLVFGLLVLHGLRHVAAARRAEVRGVALAASVCRPTSAGEVWVVPSEQPVAFAGGLWRSRAVVSSGLLAPLGASERRAVCEHEAAHVRMGHPRLLVLFGAVAAAYGRFPPVRSAWEGLRRELEAAADDEAARVVGTEALLSALVHVAALLTDEPAGPGVLAAGPGRTEHLGWRIARLEHTRPYEPWPTALVGMAALATASAMALVGCVLAGAPAGVVGVLACLGAVTLVGLRPTWAWGRHSGPG